MINFKFSCHICFPKWDTARRRHAEAEEAEYRRRNAKNECIGRRYRVRNVENAQSVHTPATFAHLCVRAQSLKALVWTCNKNVACKTTGTDLASVKWKLNYESTQDAGLRAKVSEFLSRQNFLQTSWTWTCGVRFYNQLCANQTLYAWRCETMMATRTATMAEKNDECGALGKNGVRWSRIKILRLF